MTKQVKYALRKTAVAFGSIAVATLFSGVVATSSVQANEMGDPVTSGESQPPAVVVEETEALSAETPEPKKEVTKAESKIVEKVAEPVTNPSYETVAISDIQSVLSAVFKTEADLKAWAASEGLTEGDYTISNLSSDFATGYAAQFHLADPAREEAVLASSEKAAVAAFANEDEYKEYVRNRLMVYSYDARNTVIVASNGAYTRWNGISKEVSLPISPKMESEVRDESSHLFPEGAGVWGKGAIPPYRFGYIPLISKNFKTHADYLAFVTEAENLAQQAGLTLAHGDVYVELTPMGRRFFPAGDKLFSQPIYSVNEVEAALVANGLAEYRIETSKSGEVFLINSNLGNPVSYRYSVGVEYTDKTEPFEDSKAKALSFAKELLALANKRADESWGDVTSEVPTTPETTVTLTSTADKITVTVSHKDAQLVTAITTAPVKDKLPTNIPASQIDLYDIKTVDKDGNFQQITDDALVTLPVNPNKRVLKVIYYLPETGMTEDLAFTWDQASNTVTFTVSHFSQYGVVYAEDVQSQGEVGTTEQPSTQPPVSGMIDKETPKVSSETPTTVESNEVKPSYSRVEKNHSLPKTGEKGNFLVFFGTLMLGAFGWTGFKRKHRI